MSIEKIIREAAFATFTDAHSVRITEIDDESAIVRIEQGPDTDPVARIYFYDMACETFKNIRTNEIWEV